KQKSAASVLMVFIQTNRFKETEKQYYASKVITLPVPTNDTMEISKYAGVALDLIFKTGYRYKKAGVIVSGIVSENHIQGNLFDEADRLNRNKIMTVLDKINDKYGNDTLKLAVQGTEKKWKLRQEKLSPSYTTKWSDIITVNAKS
ncbi:MAG: DUF4113 domain-containing protein, partial [Bacteroidia bacterium]|nr:DUF4113 domain-containing protein [Bacteroidia bacterium]